MELICSDKKHKIILDTDAYNEVDDQFCIAYCMLAKEKIDLLSINAAPFLNNRSTSAGEGMEKSYNEIFKVMNTELKAIAEGGTKMHRFPYIAAPIPSSRTKKHPWNPPRRTTSSIPS